MKASRSHWDEQDTIPVSASVWTPGQLLPDGDSDSDSDGAEAEDASRTADAALPPAKRRGGDSILQSLLRLWPRDGREPAPGVHTMAELRASFRASLTDLVDHARQMGDAVAEQRLLALLRQIVQSRHPQDLWHLRAAIFMEIARVHSQGEAQRRLSSLNLGLDRSRSRLRRLLDR